MKKKILHIGGNLQKTPADNRDFGLIDFYVQPKLSDIPDDWSFWKPLEIKDQKQTQQCTGHGVASAIEAHEKVILNPSVQYAFIKEIVGDPTDTGANLRDAMKSGTKYGAVKKTDCDIGVDKHNGTFLADLKNYPQEVTTLAKPQQQKSYFNATRGSYNRFDNFRSWLWYFGNKDKDKPPVIVTGVGWRENWTYAPGGIIPDEPGDVVGGHCVDILPETKMINGEHGSRLYLKIQNSYNSNIGDKGCFWFPASVINRDFTYGGYLYLDPEEVKLIIKEKSMSEGTEKQWYESKEMLVSLLTVLNVVLGKLGFGNIEMTPELYGLLMAVIAYIRFFHTSQPIAPIAGFGKKK